MSLDARTPVLVGAATVEQRREDPAQAREPLALMQAALEAAADDAGNRDLLARADAIAAPRGFWAYPDPCRLLAEALGAKGARTQVAEIGVLQTTLLGHAASAIQRGEADVVLVTGGEAKYRSLRAGRLGVEAPFTEQPAVEPDVVWRPAAEIITPLEIARGLGGAVNQFSVIENALRFAEGQGVAEHRRALAELCAGMSRIAAENPHAWTRELVSPEEVETPSERNRMLAFPYTKLHTSQWNVDQAAGLLFCSVEAARAARIPEERWVHPLAIADSNHMVPLSERAALHRCPGWEVAGRRALERAGRSIGSIAHLELYSCFPVAVRLQVREMGVPPGRPLSVSGGMTFAGGPLNNFVLQALVRMVERLRADPAGAGLLTAVSGILTKQGVSVWAAEPTGRPFAFDDVSDEVARRTRTVEVVDAGEGPARVASYTVVHHDGAPLQGVVLCDLEDGRRTIATSADPDVLRAMCEVEFCGRSVRLAPDGRFDA